VLAAAGDEAGIIRRVVDGAVGMEATRYQQRHDFGFGDGQTDIALPPKGARRRRLRSQFALTLNLGYPAAGIWRCPSRTSRRR
jgi:hypothetical protein